MSDDDADSQCSQSSSNSYNVRSAGTNDSDDSDIDNDDRISTHKLADIGDLDIGSCDDHAKDGDQSVQTKCACAGACKATSELDISLSKHKCHHIGCGLRISGLCMTTEQQEDSTKLFCRTHAESVNTSISSMETDSMNSSSSVDSIRDGYIYADNIPKTMHRDQYYGKVRLTNVVLGKDKNVRYQSMDPIIVKTYPPGYFLYVCTLWEKGVKTPNHICYDQHGKTLHHVMPSSISECKTISSPSEEVYTSAQNELTILLGKLKKEGQIPRLRRMGRVNPTMTTTKDPTPPKPSVTPTQPASPKKPTTKGMCVYVYLCSYVIRMYACMYNICM